MILPKEFYFVRHGQTDQNLLEAKDKGDHHGTIPLNEQGRLQARSIEPLIASLRVQTILSSPMRRAQETKEIITERLTVPYYEIEDLGECSGTLWKGLRELNMDSPFPEEGEVYLFVDRVERGLNQALALSGPVLIIAHGGIHRAICFLMKIEEHDWSLDNCEVVHFLFKDNQKWAAKKL